MKMKSPTLLVFLFTGAGAGASLDLPNMITLFTPDASHIPGDPDPSTSDGCRGSTQTTFQPEAGSAVTRSQHAALSGDGIHVTEHRQSGPGPGHACQITSHCAGGAESDETFAAFKNFISAWPGYCGDMARNVTQWTSSADDYKVNSSSAESITAGIPLYKSWSFVFADSDGSGGEETPYWINAQLTTNAAPGPELNDTSTSDACGLRGDTSSAYSLYASLLAYQFCVAANQSASPGEVMTRYTAADVAVWDDPSPSDGGLTAMVSLYISSKLGDLGPECEAYGLEWAGGIQKGDGSADATGTAGTAGTVVVSPVVTGKG